MSQDVANLHTRNKITLDGVSLNDTSQPSGAVNKSLSNLNKRRPEHLAKSYDKNAIKHVAD